MRLTHTSWNFQIEFDEENVCQLIIENIDNFRHLISELHSQLMLGEGSYTLWDDEILDFRSSVKLIVNPLDLDINSRKIIAGVYKNICDIINDNMYLDLCNIYAEIHSLISDAEDRLMYRLEWDSDVNMNRILKAFDVKVRKEDLTFEEKLIDYVELLQEFANVKCFIFVNLKDYCSEISLEKICRQWRYLEAFVLFIESREKYDIENEKTWIIDKDLCEIY